jgi:DNA-binding HxlR family transcriptional regulator
MNSAANIPTPDFHHHLKIFGDAWMLIIVSELLEGTCRFNELQRKVCGISPVTLTGRLKKLEELGIITRTAKAEDQLSVSYCVTEKGKAMQPALDEIRKFGANHLGIVPECESAFEAENK